MFLTKSFPAKPNIFFCVCVNGEKNSETGNAKRSETANGKRHDEEDCEMGVSVVLSSGPENSGGRICLC